MDLCMRRRLMLLALIILFIVGAQKKPITEMTIRIQSMNEKETGSWVSVPDFADLSGSSPHLSRDGKWVAWHGIHAEPELPDGIHPQRCWIAEVDGTELRKLAIGTHPRWSPDGKQLLFMKSSGIFVINRDGSGEKRLGDGGWPDWSPDGKRIVFSLGGTVHVAKLDGSERKKIANGDCPSWSPDGRKIAY